MRLKHLYLFLIWLALSGAAGAETYDFSYASGGDPRLTPLQVFDNGKQTWLQIPQLQPLPAVFAVTTAGEVLLPTRTEGQMLIVDRVEQQLAIVLGGGRASVRYVGKGQQRGNETAMFGKAEPVKVTGAAPAPVPAQQILAGRQAPAASPAPQMPSAPAEKPVTTPVLSRSGQAAKPNEPEPITELPPVSAAQEEVAVADESWEVRPEDGDLETLLQRWADKAGWQLSWEAAKRYSVKFRASFPGSFEEAAKEAILPFTRGTDPIKGCAYDNNVLRVVTKPTVCEIK